MSREFHQQTVFQPSRAHPHLTTFFVAFSIPFGKAVAADDDLFPPIRPPAAADVTAPQADDAEEEGEEDAAADADADADTDADADVDVGMGDGSDASEESDEVSSSVQE